MARSILLILSALLAFFTMLAKAEKLDFYTFITDDCRGPPMYGTIEVARDFCYDIPVAGARSVRPREQEDLAWRDDVKSGKTCKVETYKRGGCELKDSGAAESIPEIIS